MDVRVVLTSLITAGTVSGLITFFLETYFKTRLEHTYKVELEKLKSHLAIALKQNEAFISRRVAGYALIVELVYRTRNMAKDLANELSAHGLPVVSELAVRAKDLEDLLFTYRIDLERDSDFEVVHHYKNILLTFCLKASDLGYYLEHDQTDLAHQEIAEMRQIYPKLEQAYARVIRNLSERSSEYS